MTANMLALERLLEASSDPAMREALKICESRHSVSAALNLQLQAALASIRAGRSEDAVRAIELALDIEQRWAGA